MRGQTTLDFAIGTSAFLLVVVLVIAFLPTMFAPFAGGDVAGTVVADRAATTLSERVLGSPADRAVLNRTCTKAFFDGATPAGCNFATTDLHAVLGVDPQTGLNATIQRGGSIATLDGVALAAGPRPPTVSSDVTVGVRVVLLDDRRATLYLRVW